MSNIPSPPQLTDPSTGPGLFRPADPNTGTEELSDRETKEETVRAAI